MKLTLRQALGLFRAAALASWGCACLLLFGLRLSVEQKWAAGILAGLLIAYSIWEAVLSTVYALTDLFEAESGARLFRKPQEGNVTQIVESEVEGPTVRFSYYKLPLEPEVIRTIAKGALQNIPFTYKNWAGKGRPLSRNQWELAAGLFEKRGYFKKGHQWGREGLEKMRDVLTGKAQLEPLPLSEFPPVQDGLRLIRMHD